MPDNRKPTSNPPLQTSTSIADMPVPPGRKAGDYVLAYKGVAYSAIRAIANDFANINLKLYKKKVSRGEMQIEEVVEHEALSLLEYVNSFTSLYDLLEAHSIFQDTNGEAFWLILRDGAGNPAEIWHLRPDWVTILPDKKKVIAGYKYQPGNSRDAITFKPEDVIHFKNFNPGRMTRGKGTIQASAMEIDLDDFSAGYARNFFFNSAVPGILFKFKDKIDKEEMERFMKSWENSFRGMKQSHKIGAISGDVDTEPLGADIDKLGLIEQRKFYRDQILSMFQVPKSIVGISEDVNRANAEATIRAYIERVIAPRMRKFVTQLNEFYLTNWSGEDLFFDFEDPTPEDAEMKLKTYENGLRNGWLTINEVREMENLEPVDGGDAIYMPLNLVPIGSVTDKVKSLFDRAKKSDGVLVMPVKEGKKKIKTNIRIPAKKLHELRKDILKKKIKGDVKKLLSTVVKVSEDELKRESIWRQLIAKTDVWEEIVKERTVKLLNEQEAIVIGKIEGKKAQEDIARFLFDLASENTKWKDSLEPIIKTIIKEQGRDTLSFLGLQNDVDMTHALVVDYLKEFSGELIKGINKTTLKDLRGELAEGTKEGESIPELKRRVESVFTQARGPRSEMIARTEVLRASNFATDVAYRQSDIVKGKEWLTAIDSRVCPICAPLDTKTAKLDENFKTSVGDVEYPPAHPSCRCTTIPVLLD